jgi:hypothetical protein
MPHPIRRCSKFFAFAAAAALASAGTAFAVSPTQQAHAGSATQTGPVEVYWAEPATFSEVRLSANPKAAIRGDWVRELADYVQQEALRRLEAGDRMEVVIKDIDRAGDLLPGHDTRLMRQLAAPMMKLSFVHRNAAGEVVDHGERTLRDLSYLQDSPGRLDTDPLRFEKHMIRRWIARELPAA